MEICLPAIGFGSFRGFAQKAHVGGERHFNVKGLDLEFELVARRGRYEVNGCAFRRKQRVVAGAQPVVQAELYSVFEEIFRHASMGKLVYFLFAHPGRHCDVPASDRDAIANGLKVLRDFLVGSFVA